MLQNHAGAPRSTRRYMLANAHSTLPGMTALPGVSPTAAVDAIAEAHDGIGDTCPECPEN